MWPVDRFGIIHRDVALDAGISEKTIARAVHAGQLCVVARGRYVPTPVTHNDDADDVLYRARCVAAATGPGRPVLSHDSAAAVHGLRLLGPDRGRVHVTTGRESGGSRRSRRIIHAGLLPSDDVVEIGGVLVTSLARTAVDVALAAGTFAQALTAFDGIVADHEVREQAARLLSAPRHGIALVRRAHALADGRSESPGESWSRAQMIEARLPVMDLQVEYRLGSGGRAFCDFSLDDVFVGEFDGLVKYRRGMRRDEDPESIVIREKIREDELRDLGLDVGRWIWADLRGRTMVPKVCVRLDRLGIRYG
ncbi:type IV toxin-antitoxin system AbiEi family antitoxin domain-containing protein [Gordonia humi]|uniref:Transcriptional regulator, AbiEi antitoxin, Type IV TA system n=1 Tax=Gordonia humi TaxID=686429 RepID=A0A840EZV4_9ACTN|nr:hypothetical protein [Gordonia humi]MBB4137162.1 hypothetical protein [Gordonia humi]